MTGINHEIGKYLVPINSQMAGLELVLNSKKPYAFISARNFLIYSTIKLSSDRYYIPPENEECQWSCTRTFLTRKSLIICK